MQKKEILIVEDEPMTRKMLQHLLDKTPDYTTCCCDTVQAAMEVLDRRPVQAIISDLQMPGLDGRELIQRVRQHPQHQYTPIVVLSSAQESQVRVECLKMGADDFLVKPFSPQELLAKLEVLARRQAVAVVPEVQASVLDSSKPHSNRWMGLLWGKRLFDIIVSGTALLILLPLLLIIALLIRLDSKGPVVYSSQRVGTGYAIFDLYKFRTMRTDADRLLNAMTALNLYNDEDSVSSEVGCADCAVVGSCQNRLLDEGGTWVCEKNHLSSSNRKPAFMKFKNDPRITTLGRFLRNTSRSYGIYSSEICPS